MSTCQNCGSDVGADAPPNPSHCGDCPPWECEDCGLTCSSERLCECWTRIDDMQMADIKALFASADDGLSLGQHRRGSERGQG